MADPYLTTAVQIMTRGRNTNSYKFALLRSLAAFGISPGLDAATVSLERLAGQFLKFYWPITLRFQIRQASVPDRDPVVMRLIREERAALGLSPETGLEDFQRTNRARHQALVGKVAREAFDDVIPRFHTVAGRPIEPKLYEPDDDGIYVSSEVRAFLKQNHKALDLLAIGAWVKFTEKYTSAPRLYEKIEGLIPRRSTLKAYREFLQERGVVDCFYCGDLLSQNPHVDHVVPWRFVLEDRVWNLVMVCDTCNGAKSSMTPPDEYIDRVCKRNAELLEIDERDLPRKIRSDLVEWRGKRLSEELRVLVERCRGDGFGSWIGP